MFASKRHRSATAPIVRRPAVPVRPRAIPVDPSAGLDEVWRISTALQIKGDLSADMDVSIDGGFDGSIRLDGHRLALGAGGRLAGDVHARSVLIRGEVLGNIVAEEEVKLTRTAIVRGDIRAPRVRMDDGCMVKGRVEQG